MTNDNEILRRLASDLRLAGKAERTVESYIYAAKRLRRACGIQLLFQYRRSAVRNAGSDTGLRLRGRDSARFTARAFPSQGNGVGIGGWSCPLRESLLGGLLP